MYWLINKKLYLFSGTASQCIVSLLDSLAGAEAIMDALTGSDATAVSFIGSGENVRQPNSGRSTGATGRQSESGRSISETN